MDDYKPHINIRAMDETELRKFCRLLGFGVIEEDIAVYKIIERLKGTEIRQIMGYSHSEYYRRLNKIKSYPEFRHI